MEIHYVVDVHIKETEIRQMVGNSVISKIVVSSGIPGSHNQGGQSQQRFLRKHMEAVKAYTKHIKKKIAGLEPIEFTGNRLMIQFLQ